MSENYKVPYPSFNENQNNNNTDEFHSKENMDIENPLQTKGNKIKSENILLFSNNPSQLEESRSEIKDQEQNQMSIQQAISTKNQEIKKNIPALNLGNINSQQNQNINQNEIGNFNFGQNEEKEKNYLNSSTCVVTDRDLKEDSKKLELKEKLSPNFKNDISKKKEDKNIQKLNKINFNEINNNISNEIEGNISNTEGINSGNINNISINNNENVNINSKKSKDLNTNHDLLSNNNSNSNINSNNNLMNKINVNNYKNENNSHNVSLTPDSVDTNNNIRENNEGLTNDIMNNEKNDSNNDLYIQNKSNSNNIDSNHIFNNNKESNNKLNNNFINKNTNNINEINSHNNKKYINGNYNPMNINQNTNNHSHNNQNINNNNNNQLNNNKDIINNYKDIQNNNNELHLDNQNVIKDDKNKIIVGEKNKGAKYSFSRYTKEPMTGLTNLGDTSYLNAILRLIASIRNIASYFLNPINQKNIYKDIKIYRLSFVFCRLFIHLYPFPEKKEREIYSPDNFLKALGYLNVAFKSMKKRNPNELLIFLLNELHNELNQLKNIKIDNIPNQNTNNRNSVISNEINKFIKTNNSIISNNLNWFEVKESQCTKCNQSTYNFYSFNVFELDIYGTYQYKSSSINLIDCLHYYKIPKKQKLFCNNCRNYEEILNSLNIYLTSKTVIFSLNRGDLDKNNLLKIDFSIQEKLDLTFFIEKIQSLPQYELNGIVSIAKEKNNYIYICFYKSPIDHQWYLLQNEKIYRMELKDIINYHNTQRKFIPCILYYKEFANI